MAKFDPPKHFDFSRPNDWVDWIDTFKRFRLATKLHKEENEIQISALIYSMGSDADKILKTLKLDRNADESLKANVTFEQVVKKFDTYFMPKVNLFHEQLKFDSRCQQDGESAEHFIRDLYTLSEKCKFTDRDRRIKVRLVNGLQDAKLKIELQLKDSTLDEIITQVRQHEMVKSQSKAGVSTSTLDYVQKGKPTYPCSRCGKNHFRNSYCAAYGKQCQNCQGWNHFTNMCYNKSTGYNQSQSHSRGNFNSSRYQQQSDSRYHQQSANKTGNQSSRPNFQGPRRGRVLAEVAEENIEEENIDYIFN